MLALVLVTMLVSLVVPSAIAAWRMRRLAARLDSLMDLVASLVTARVLVVGFLALVHLPAVFVLARERSPMEPAAPGHQYGPRFEAWRSDLIGACHLGALAALLALLVVVVVLVAELVAIARLLAARRRLAEAEPATSIPSAEAPLEFDLGEGEGYWVFSRESEVGYRQPPPPARFARGSTDGWSAASLVLAGPVVTLFTFAVTFALFSADALFSGG